MPGGRPKGLPKTGGRQKGTPNKRTALLKDAILEAAEKAGGQGGIVGYLTLQATKNPGPFMTLLGKVLPTQITGEDGAPVQIEEIRRDADDFARSVRDLAARAAGEDGGAAG